MALYGLAIIPILGYIAKGLSAIASATKTLTEDMSKTQITLRPPGKSWADLNWSPPPIDWIEGTWYVTHSTLPMWQTKKNLRITYKPLPRRDGAIPPGLLRVDDSVSYEDLDSGKAGKVHGIDTSSTSDNTGCWEWRGTGLLFFITSHWEFLGWGDGDGDERSESVPMGKERDTLPVPDTQVDWAVTYFSKTFFTPAGIDIYSRSVGGHSPEQLSAIKTALSKIDDENVRKLAGDMFEIVHDTVEPK